MDEITWTEIGDRQFIGAIIEHANNNGFACSAIRIAPEGFSVENLAALFTEEAQETAKWTLSATKKPVV